ncbi:hypothetical protein CALCODRAFT_431263, partial [Calocera cornea HHB12733]
SKITNIRLKYLPPNMTSHVQPPDAGIICTFKAHYKQLFCQHAVDLEGAGIIHIYDINLLKAMQLCL